MKDKKNQRLAHNVALGDVVKDALLLSEDERKKILEFDIREKGDWKLWHLYIPLFFLIVGIFSPEKKELFYNRYWTIQGGTIYIPVGRQLKKEDIDILMHEAQHRIDYESSPIRCKLGYLFSNKTRAELEMRGYAMNMLFEFRETGKISFRTKQWVIDKLAHDSVYVLRGDGMISEVEAYILMEPIVGKIRSGEINTFLEGWGRK